MLTGAILAGGENRRMNGRVKALLPFSGELLIQRQIREMQLICVEVIVVTNQPDLFSPILDPMVRVISDLFPRKGPLSGIHAALSNSNHQDVWIVACDMPFISAEAAALMQEMKWRRRDQEKRVSAVIPTSLDRIHPLHGIYDRQCSALIPEMFKKGEHRVMELLKLMDWEAADEFFWKEKGLDLLFTTNMNTHEEYLRAITLTGGSNGRQ